MDESMADRQRPSVVHYTAAAAAAARAGGHKKQACEINLLTDGG